jgi:hypothetical protein
MKAVIELSAEYSRIRFTSERRKALSADSHIVSEDAYSVNNVIIARDGSLRRYGKQYAPSWCSLLLFAFGGMLSRSLFRYQDVLLKNGLGVGALSELQ